MYQFEGRVRFSETAPDRKISIMGLMNYLQDCSIFHSEDIGVGFGYLEQAQRAWLLSAWNVEIIRRPAVTEKITVMTWPYAFKGIYGLRNFAIADQNGEFLVKADSCWFLFDTASGRPARPTKEDIAPYQTGDLRLDMEELPRKIALPDGLQEAGEMTVMRHHLDTNHHVNNVQYVGMACEILPEGFEIHGIRAEYRKAAVLGDVICLKYAEQDGVYTVALCAEDGSVYAVVQMR